MSERLKGKVAIITGAASGIGAVTTSLFAREGATVIAVDLPGEERQAAVAALAAGTGRIEFAGVDVTKPAAVNALIAETDQRHGGIDVLFNNAGMTLIKPLDQTTDADYDLCMDVNVRGVFNGIRAVLPIMKRRRTGVILSTASNAGTIGRPMLPLYGAAKGAVVQMTKALAQGVGGYGIRVNCICPGGVNTPMLPDPAAAQATHGAINPLGRLAEPEDIARAALFLASEEAVYITGIALAVDGGWTSGVRESPAVMAALQPKA
jgi:3-oxoacyl-[acyl-carrier protein] reductase